MNKRSTYRLADVIIGGLCGGTAGACISIAVVFGLPDFEIESPWIFGAILSGCGFCLCGLMGFLWGQQFTHTFEDGVQEFMRFFRSDHE